MSHRSYKESRIIKFPDSKNLTGTGNQVTIRVYRELMELCDFLLLSSSGVDQKEAAKAVNSRLQDSRKALGQQTADVAEALRLLEVAAHDVSASEVLPNLLKENILKSRELIERALNAVEVTKNFTFEDTLHQIESLCEMIRANGPNEEGQKHFDNAEKMLHLIMAYRADREASIAGEITQLLEEIESEPHYVKPPQRTGRPASQFKRIWGQLMREGVDVMHPLKGWAAICDWLREQGEPEERLPTKSQIEKLYKEWTS